MVFEPLECILFAKDFLGEAQSQVKWKELDIL